MEYKVLLFICFQFKFLNVRFLIHPSLCRRVSVPELPKIITDYLKLDFSSGRPLLGECIRQNAAIGGYLFDAYIFPLKEIVSFWMQ